MDSKPSKKYWKNKRVLITGITGFAGSHLAEQLVGLNAEVFGITRENKKQYPNLKKIRKKIVLEKASILDERQILSVLKKHGIQVIFHLAAQSSVPRAFANPKETMELNFISVKKLLNAAKKYGGVEKIIFASSSQEYGLIKPSEVPVKESNPLRPMNPYAQAKILATKACVQYWKKFGLPVVVTRAFNHIGPRQDETFIVPTIVRQALEISKGKRKEFELENASTKRDFTNVRDMASGYLLAAQNGRPGQVYNLCFGKAYSIKQIAQIVAKLVGGVKSKIKENSNLRPNHLPLVLGDAGKARRELGFSPRISLKQTLKQIIASQE